MDADISLSLRRQKKSHPRTVTFKTGAELAVVQYFDSDTPLPGFVSTDNCSSHTEDAQKRHAAFASAARQEHESEWIAVHELSPTGALRVFCLVSR